jgi:hypothetical protein
MAGVQTTTTCRVRSPSAASRALLIVSRCNVGQTATWPLIGAICALPPSTSCSNKTVITSFRDACHSAGMSLVHFAERCVEPQIHTCCTIQGLSTPRYSMTSVSCASARSLPLVHYTFGALVPRAADSGKHQESGEAHATASSINRLPSEHWPL